MSPTVTVAHLASVTTATDDSDDMKIYEFDRDAILSGGDGVIGGCCCDCTIGSVYTAYDEVLAA